MPPSTHTIFALLAALIVLATAAHHFNTDTLELTRVFNLATRDTYALICKRAPDIADAFVFTDVPPEPLDTLGRSNATVHCITRVYRTLFANCTHLNATQFEHYAQPVLDECVHRAPISAADASDTRPFSFDRSRCKSKLAWSGNAMHSTVTFVCECLQSGFYEVLPGWPRFFLDGSEADTAVERQAMLQCASEADERMREVCLRRPGDYDVLGLQVLQACCKRVRVASTRKFACAPVVPRDLSALKYEFR